MVFEKILGIKAELVSQIKRFGAQRWVLQVALLQRLLQVEPLALIAIKFSLIFLMRTGSKRDFYPNFVRSLGLATWPFAQAAEQRALYSLVYILFWFWV